MIESLHSPHVARVKALIGSKGVRERRDSKLFVAEGLQSVREALHNPPHISTLYLTTAGAAKVDGAELDISSIEVFEVKDAVMEAMASTITPQGILALCELPERRVDVPKVRSAIYLYEIQDPGNAGTILRTADAFGIDAVITSPGSVDMYSPKVVRATAGSLWHIDLYEGVPFDIVKISGAQLLALTARAEREIGSISFSQPTIAIFGNEARGLDESLIDEVIGVKIPMKGRAESLNLSAAASIVMYEISRISK